MSLKLYRTRFSRQNMKLLLFLLFPPFSYVILQKCFVKILHIPPFFKTAVNIPAEEENDKEMFYSHSMLFIYKDKKKLY